jgi:beta-glucanase (GH16 family)
MFSIFLNSKILKYLIFIFLFSCGGGGDEPNPNPNPETEVVIPTNLALSVIIVGTNTSNPNGDGSGVIQCTASATNTVKYEFRFGGGVIIESSTGNVSHTFTDKGTNNYTVTVIAYSKTGHSVSTFKNIAVYVKEDIFNVLKFSDEFDIPGNPDSSKWNYDIGTGQGGWGNNEKQYYTNRSDNVKVENGVLKITAKKENYQTSNYTSSRIKTQNKFDFKYGRVEVKAKLPIGKGTWPAIWMLGSNITTVGWPACGEIDIMEHVGNDQGNIHNSIHTPSSYGATVNSKKKFISDVSTAFHIYEVIWTSQEIIFSIDGVENYRYNPASKNSSTWPFDANQFLILNVAMGGNFGGSIDPVFTQSTMEIDYVRVYQ